MKTSWSRLRRTCPSIARLPRRRHGLDPSELGANRERTRRPPILARTLEGPRRQLCGWDGTGEQTKALERHVGRPLAKRQDAKAAQPVRTHERLDRPPVAAEVAECGRRVVEALGQRLAHAERGEEVALPG